MSGSDERRGPGVAGEEQPGAGSPSAGSALGSDPFETQSDPEALGEWLDAAERFIEGRIDLGASAKAAGPAIGAKVRELPRTRRVAERPPPPKLADVELPPPAGALERILSDDARRRLEALTAALPKEGTYDHFGLSATVIRSALPFLYALYRLYFRVRSEGHRHIPAEGPGVMVANHGGLLPFDGAMICVDVFLNTDPPRLARSIVDRWAGTLPFVNVAFARLGQVIGTPENFTALLRQGDLILEFPEGIDGIRKPINQRYQLQHFHVGFVEHALRSKAPIVPVAVIGSDDQAPILYDLKPLARLLRLPVAPITPTFPWFGPIGLLPYPVSYRVIYGEPLLLHERFGPESAEDAPLVRELASEVRRKVQNLVDRNR